MDLMVIPSDMGASAGRRAGDHHIKVGPLLWSTLWLMFSSREQSPHPAAENMESNNNIAGILHQDRLYLAWRTAPLHFAGRDTR